MGGQQKVPEDLVEFWVELLGRYQSVVAIIDPMRKQVIQFVFKLDDFYILFQFLCKIQEELIKFTTHKL